MAKRVVAITGCDSGLGWAMAARTAREGLVTIAGMYKGTETQAALALKKLNAHPCTLDVTRAESVRDFQKYVMKILEENPEYRLYAVVNNAGVMPIGDFEWHTPNMIEKTINVNLLGTMRVVSQFLPALRTAAVEKKLNPRIINVASHCGMQPLPGFGPYSASKAGVLSITRALRLELRPYGVTTVGFVPGGFVAASNLLQQQTHIAEAMFNEMSDDQRSVYGERITALTNYLKPAASANLDKYDSMNDPNIINTFMKALEDENPKRIYKVENLRYMIYYFLMKLPLPESVHCWLVKKFVSFPN